MPEYSIPNVKIFEYTKIIGIENINFGKYVIIDDFSLVYAKRKCTIGNYVHVASFTSISGSGEFILEDYTAISSGCRIFTSTDDFKGFGFGNSTVDDSFRNLTSSKIHIKKFAIIGANSVILPGVTIGEGASIGANSVITKDLDPWGIYIGNKKVGTRDKEKVLKNYQRFLDTPEESRVGNLFK